MLLRRGTMIWTPTIRCGSLSGDDPRVRTTLECHLGPGRLTDYVKYHIIPVESYDGNAYRAVYAVRYADAVYVLHAFQKKSKKGIATPKAEIDLIEKRLKDLIKEKEGRQ
jgi:Phage derived protein Gp49-like (DUF891)